MPRTPQYTMPPRGRQQQNQNTVRPEGQQANPGGGQSAAASPAYSMARRIRNEQGLERARQYLMAMEPFLAPMERAHIAEQLGVTLPLRPQQQPQNAPPSFNQAQQQAPFGGMPFGQTQQQAPFGQMGGLPFMGQGGMGNNPLQMMQMLSGLGNMGKKTGQQSGGGMGDPMMLAQMLGSLMGKK